MIRKMYGSILMQLTCIVLAILAAMTVALAGTIAYARGSMRDNAVTLADSLLKQGNNAVDLYKDSLRYTATYLCRFPIIERLGVEDGSDAPDGNDASAGGKKASAENDIAAMQLSSYFSQIRYKNREILAAIVFNKIMQVFASLGQEVEIPRRQLYLRYEEELNSDLYLPGGKSAYAFYYPIYSTYDQTGREPEGMCVLIMDHWIIEGTERNILRNQSAALLLSDSQNLELCFITSGDVKASGMEQLKGDRNYLYREGDWHNGIRIAVAVPVFGNAEANRSIWRLIAWSYLLIIALTVVIVLFSYYRMALPIHRINRFIQESMANPGARLDMRREDEIGAVAASLNQMLDENQVMIKEIKEHKIRLYETQLARQEMEILAYRNQINPHFLYNMLSCMRDMALFHDEDDIAEMAMALSDIFRYAVKGSNIVTVRDEIEHIGRYARIIDYRFMGKITTRVHAAEDTLDKPMIRFFLQPLVENSVFHGLEEKLGPGTVDVTIRGTEGLLEVTVEDDGLGMNEETVEKIRKAFESPGENAEGIGIGNIAQRLRLFYGDAYRTEVKSEAGQGTWIRITIPDQVRKG